ncbi:CYFIP-related Rac1 interactor B isoform X1 [Astyanax mexicanus]|uniref:CYFIP-related Rac1 interactor B isoform X1 n=1 Tax=Astyanax mexicanus TaxID=7994 RepID=UPI0020CAD3B1|nr:CYFIP-related Rac1 interactor B isoform X1 [Astyanax mexicanus]
MGNLIKVLTRDIDNNAGNFFLDFENAQPTEAERQQWEQVSAVLEEAMSILQDLQSYSGAGEAIRQAIQQPNDESVQEKAWSSVVPLVGKLKKFYEFSVKLEGTLHGLLGFLTSARCSPTQHLEQEQALARQFAEILHFTLRFDELKMTNPAIQNDFSYYRRTLSRMRINNLATEEENEVNNELANRMSLFYANATPMLKTLSDATTKFVSDNTDLPIENTTDCLSTMASVCKVMLETPEYRSRFASEDTVLFCLRVMVGVIILYDYVHPAGAFVKSSKIDMHTNIKNTLIAPYPHTFISTQDLPVSSKEGTIPARSSWTSGGGHKSVSQEEGEMSTERAIRSMMGLVWKTKAAKYIFFCYKTQQSENLFQLGIKNVIQWAFSKYSAGHIAIFTLKMSLITRCTSLQNDLILLQVQKK